MDTTVLLGVLAILIFYALWRNVSRKNIPPGPFGLPIVGYLPYLSRRPYLDLQKISETYGGIFSIRLGSYYAVVLNDFESTKDAFARDDFIGRPPMFPFKLNQESIDTDAFLGLPSKELRRFSLQALRNLGLGKSKMEDHIQEEILELMEHFEEEAGKPMDIRRYLPSSMSNNIASMVFGKRYPYNDPDRLMLTESVNEIVRRGGQVAIHLFFPWLLGILKKFPIFQKLGEENKDLKNYIAKEIDKHAKTVTSNKVRDVIDAFLLEMPKKENNPIFCKPVLQDLALGFFAAGSETVRITVEWLMLTMAGYQHVQRRVQEEIDDVIGSHRLPSWLDSKNMPYTEAVISEVMRWKTIIPINLLRYTIKDTELSGYFIPKHTVVIANLWSIHHDQEYWGKDAEDFRPERFLTQDGKSVKKMERFIPFSIGKRACPGENLAKVEVFLYFASILQRFNVAPPEGKTVDFETDLGVSLLPRSQKLLLERRKA